MPTLIDVIIENNLYKGNHTNGTDKECLPHATNLPANECYGHYYISNFYQKEFEKLQYNNIKLLEIGVYTGASLKMWKKFFVNGIIEGVDIFDHRLPEYIDNDIKYYNNDAYDIYFVEKLSNDYDIIIDDGPHTLDSNLAFIDLYFDKIKKGGYLIIEDILQGGHLAAIYDKLKIKFRKQPNIVDRTMETNCPGEIIAWIQK